MTHETAAVVGAEANMLVVWPSCMYAATKELFRSYDIGSHFTNLRCKSWQDFKFVMPIPRTNEEDSISGRLIKVRQNAIIVWID